MPHITMVIIEEVVLTLTLFLSVIRAVIRAVILIVIRAVETVIVMEMMVLTTASKYI